MSERLPTPIPMMFPSKVQRQAAKTLERIETATAIAIRADTARLERATETTQRGMIAAAHLASVEAALCQTAPHAAERIRAVACAGTMNIVGIVHDADGGF